jgi:hypothetical protein
MKQVISTLLVIVVVLVGKAGKAQFLENSVVRTSFTLLLTNMSTDGAVALQTSNYDIESHTTIVKSMILDLNGFNLTNTSSVYSCTLTDGLWFALKSSTGSGIFSGKIKFGGSTSVLKVLSSEVLGTGFSIDATGESGKIEIGDGSTSLTQSLSTTQCNGKVSLITVRSGATLIVSM